MDLNSRTKGLRYRSKFTVADMGFVFCSCRHFIELFLTIIALSEKTNEALWRDESDGGCSVLMFASSFACLLSLTPN